MDFKARIQLSGRTATGIEQKALAGDAQALRCFDGLSYSRIQRFRLPIEQAKTPETRARRIEKAVVDLRAQRV